MKSKSQRKKKKEPVFERRLTGIVKRHPDGFGFLIPDEARIPDVYIPRQAMEGIMSNDQIEIAVTLEKGGDRLRGSDAKVLRRSVGRAVGRIHKTAPDRGFLRDESHAWGEDLKITFPPGDVVNDGDWVAAEITGYPDSPRGFTGRLSGVIGNVLDPLNDDRRVILTHGIPMHFSPEAEAQAKQLERAGAPTPEPEREDLSHLPFVTIDGKTAKDFDDAIFVKEEPGGFRIWVAIADVSHYVKPGSPIDQDAYQRGTSTYFPRMVVPMLPEVLSNELCSLKPNVGRYALTAEMVVGKDGVLHDSRFCEALIRSRARLTYGEAQEAIEGDPSEKVRPLLEPLLAAARAAQALMARRLEQGSLDLDLPETELEIDEAGEPVDVIKAERLFSHRLIEELMLIANVAAARFLKAKKVAGLYRIHEDPPGDAIAVLEKFLDAFGFKTRLAGTQLQKQITRALKFFEGQPQEHIIHILTLRSMSQAQYSPRNVGHFGLAFPDYVHFTSPIRRYPDLIVHRQLKAIIAPGRYPPATTEEELATQGTWLSACEQRSAKAERQLRAIKKARFIHRHLGQEFEGMISSVARFGVFVILRQFDVDGLVRLDSLGKDQFEFDEENLRLVGRRSGRVFNIGDRLMVQVAASDPDLGRVEFELVRGKDDGSQNEDKSVSAPPPTAARRKNKKNRRGLRQTRVRRPRRKS